jgi:hypothetical protein
MLLLSSFGFASATSRIGLAVLGAATVCAVAVAGGGGGGGGAGVGSGGGAIMFVWLQRHWL